MNKQWDDQTKLPRSLRRKIPKHPDGTPMLKLTVRGTLERTRYQGKLWALPRSFKIPPEYVVTAANAKRKGPKCGAPKDNKSSSGEGFCTQPAGWGTEHKGSGPCKLHGGNLPAVTKKHLRKIQGAEMATFGEPIEIDPHTAVLKTLQASAGHAAWLLEKIQALSEVEGDMTLQQYTAMGIKASVWVEMYERERIMVLKTAKAAVEMGVSERQVQLAEEQGRMIAMLLQKFLDSQVIALTPAQRQAAPGVIRQLLTEMPQVTGPGETNAPLQPLPPAGTLSPPTEEEEWENFG